MFLWCVTILFFTSEYIIIQDSSLADSVAEANCIKSRNILGSITFVYIVILVIMNALNINLISKRLDYYDVFLRGVILSIAAFMGLIIYSKFYEYIY